MRTVAGFTLAGFGLVLIAAAVLPKGKEGLRR
jgi:hypothetical protein